MQKNTELTTVWGESLSNNPLQEYPRPQFRRDSYINLNGLWQYAITADSTIPTRFDGDILVPFSPECQLSRVLRAVNPKDFLHYQREFHVPKSFHKGVVLLHFGAVDSICEVFVNGIHAGGHTGGYNPFEIDITQFVAVGQNTLNVVVQDFTDTSYCSNGKQSSRAMGMWYTPQSGIWQTVWLESVAEQYIKSCKLTPLFDQAKLRIELDKVNVDNVTAIVLDGEREIAKADSRENCFEVELPKDFKQWSPENPFLYDLQLVSRRDKVSSYFGMRKFSIERDSKGILRTFVNNKPYFHNGVLDQGYWCDGLYTAPSDEAMIFDIQQMKDLGFNMLRKHIKVEPLRWYYHCDKLGMLVWQDMPSGGSLQKKSYTLYLPFLGMRKFRDTKLFYHRFSRRNAKGREMFAREYAEMIDRLYNATSIAVWVPFNEAWGQFDAKKWGEWTAQYDPSRLVDHASGWHDQGGRDFLSLHIYFKKAKLRTSKNRAIAMTEFGGYCFKLKEHSYNPDYTYGYAHFESKEAFACGLAELFERDVVANIEKGLTATVYTQVSDVEDEVNGLLTYDRRVLKISPEKMRQINSKVKL